jgi:hypothetical protein
MPHEFVEDRDGNVVALAERESEDDFHAFFDGQQEIRQVTADVGVTGQPTVTTYRILSTPDRF